MSSFTFTLFGFSNFCDFADVEYQRLMQHDNTRFLSLLSSLERVLEMFEASKSYFNSQEHCPTIIRQCFENPTQELNLWFVYEQLKYFNETMLKLERQKTSAVDVTIVLTELQLNLPQNRVSS